MSRSDELRQDLVRALARGDSLRSPALRAAFLTIPREAFVPELAAEHGLEWVYADEALVTRTRDGLPTSSSSQPTIMALMLEALDVRPGVKVLEVGLGTGYNAAMLRVLTGPDGSVTSVDIDPDVVAAAERALASLGIEVRSVVGDGAAGYAPGAPYERIVVTASTDHLPYPWWEQLAPGGALVVPLRCGAMSLVGVFARTPTGFATTAVIPGGFMPMRPAPDAPSPGVTLTVGDEGAAVSGPGLAALGGAARSALADRLAGPPRPLAVDGGLSRPGLLHALMLVDQHRQISMYVPGSGNRLGIVDASGAAALVPVTHTGDAMRAGAIELYGPAEHLGAELADAVRLWQAAGRPAFERMAIAFDYDPVAPVPPWAVTTWHAYGQRRSMGWRGAGWRDAGWRDAGWRDAGWRAIMAGRSWKADQVGHRGARRSSQH